MIQLRSLFFKKPFRLVSFLSTPKYWASNETLASKELKTQEVPVHLRPYDKHKYEVPSSKMKVSIEILNI